jgi:GNAT superfamily N-acetyltransferase
MDFSRRFQKLLIVDPDYQRRGIGRGLMFRAAAPRGTLFFWRTTAKRWLF